MKHLLRLLLLALPLAGQVTTLLRHGSGWCSPTNVSNASPPVLTCAADPGWATGDAIEITNLLVAGPAYSPVNGLVYVVRLSGGTTYELHSSPGSPPSSPLSAPGVYLAGTAQRWAGRASRSVTIPATEGLRSVELMRAHRCTVENGCLVSIVVTGGVAVATMSGGPQFTVGKGIGIWGSPVANLNTSTGVVTAATSTTVSWTTTAANGTYTDATTNVSARGHDLNPAWTGLKSSCALAETGSYQYPLEFHLSCAWQYYVDRSASAALTNAKLGVTRVEDVVHRTFGCNTAVSYCGGRNDTDYVRHALIRAAEIFMLLDSADALTAGQRSTFRSKVLTSKATDPSCTLPPIVNLTGTVSRSGATLTGTGTAFSTELSAGGTVWVGTVGDDASALFVDSITSNTVATVRQLDENNSGSPLSGTAQFTRGWQSGDCGALQIAKSHRLSIIASPEVDGADNGSEQPEQEYFNLSFTALTAYVYVGVALAPYDTRAVTLLRSAMNIGWDDQIATAIALGAGAQPMGGNYGWQRSWMHARVKSALARIGYVDLTGPWQSSILDVVPYGWTGDLQPTGEARATNYGDSNRPLDNYWVAPTTGVEMSTAQRQRYQAFMRGWCGGTITAGCVSNSFGAGYAYAGYDPQLPDFDLRTIPLAFVGNTSSRALCSGARSCYNVSPMSYAVSRTDWGSATGGTAAKFYLNGGTFVIDHYHPTEGNWGLNMGTAVSNGAQYHFIGVDGADNAAQLLPYSTGALQKNMVVLSAYPRQDAPEPWLSTASMDRKSDVALSTHQYIRMNNAGAFNPSPTALERHFAHVRGLTGGKSIVAIYDRVSASSAGRIDTAVHFTQNGQSGEGTTTCAGSACAVNTNLTGVVHSENLGGLFTESLTVYPVSGQRGYRFIEQTNGAYTDGRGYTFRLGLCATANDTTCNASATGFQAVTFVAENTTLSSASAIAVSGFSGGTATTAGGNVAVLFASGADQAGVPAFTLGATSKLLVAGLTPGTYKVQVGGADVGGCTSIAVSANDNSLFCPAVGAGSVTLAALSGASGSGAAVRGTLRGVIR